MKKTLSLLLTTLLIISFTAEPEYKLTETQAVKIYQKLQMLNAILPESEVPAKVASQSIKETSELMLIIEEQYKKHHPDTTKKR